MADLKISSLLERPISQEHWPYLQQIIKGLNEFILQRAKNREYLEAQRAKQKIIECQDEIKKRNRFQIQEREQQAIEQLTRSHLEQKAKLQKEWQIRSKKIEREHQEVMAKKIQRFQLDKQKYAQQLQMAMPNSSSPDKQIFHLKHQEEQAVSCGDFVEAQKIKMQIMKKEVELSKKYQKLRENNIKTMMSELQSKQSNEILLLEARKEEKLSEIQKSKSKRLKQLGDKHEREIKQLIWVYNEQKKKTK